MIVEPQTFVEAHLYPSREAVIEDALRSLLQAKPQLRIELAIYQYQTEDISLAKAAHLAAVSFDQMKELLVQRGVQLRLGPANDEEVAQEIAALDRLLEKRNF